MTSVDPRMERNELFGRVLRVPLLIIGLTSVSAMVVTGAAERFLAWSTMVVLIATPLVRVGWLVVRWHGRGDRRFALAGTSLLVIVAIGTAIALS